MRRKFWTCGLIVLTTALAGAAPQPSADSPLAVRQQAVHRMIADMEERFVRLAQSLESTEPENAARLVETLQRSKQEMIEPRMAKVAELLNTGNLEAAKVEQQKLIDDLQQLIDMLTGVDKLTELMRQAEQLREFQEQLDRLIAQQTELKSDTDALTDKDGAAADVEAQIAALKALIDRQQSLNQRGAEAREKGLPGLDRAADDQAAVRRDTEQLAQTMNADPATGRPAQSLRQASDHQRLAESDLAAGRSSDAADAQQQALQQMRQALEQLEQRRQRIARLRESDAPKLADDQNALGEQTAGLSKQMAENNQSSGASGQSQTQSASQQMQQAAQQLEQQQPSTASPHQQKALDELQQAREQLEERLRQLRDQMQEQALAALESRFRQMLERQRPLTTAVAELDQSRADRPLDRAQKLLASGYAAEERALADLADTTLDIIREDGTTVVLPAIVGQLHDDLIAAAELLAEERTDTYTRTLQQNIERTLEQLIDALQRAQQQNQQQAQSGQQSGDQQQLPPLVPGSAELKLLKSAQLQVNRRTTALDEAQNGESSSSTLRSESQRLADRQEQLRQMARKMSESGQ